MTHAAGIVAGTQVRRVVRGILSNRMKLLLYAVAGLIGIVPVLLVGSVLLARAGERLAAGVVGSGTLEQVTGIVSGATALALISLTGMATIRSVTNVADVDKPACVLLSTSLRNVVLGLLAAELLFFALWLTPVTLVLSGSFAYGAGTPLPALAAPLLLLVLLAVAVPVGFVLGVCIRHLLTVYEPVARYRTPLLIAAGVAYFAAVALGWIGPITTLLFDLLGDSPLGWPGHILLAGIPAVAFSAARIAGALGAVALLVPTAVVTGISAADFHWFADPARTDDGAPADVESGDWLSAALTPVASQPLRTVTVTAIRRTKRAPARLLYVAYPLFMSLFFVEELVQTGSLPTTGALALAVYVVWGTGAAFTLNLLGDHGPAMESVLISTVSGREVVGGTVLAGVLVGVPAALLVGPVAGLVSPLSSAETAVLIAGMLVGVAASSVLATGVGTLFPRFGSVQVMNKREAVMPSKTAFLVYTLAIVLPCGAAATLTVDGAPSVVARTVTGLLSLLPVSPGVTAGLVIALAWIVLTLGIAAPFVSVWYAIRRFDSYRPY